MMSIVPPNTYGEAATNILIEKHSELRGMQLGEIRIVEPAKPLVKGESRFLILENDYGFEGIEDWQNKPARLLFVGSGRGLSLLDQPQAFIRKEGSLNIPDVETKGMFLLVSKSALDVIKRFSPDEIDVVPAERLDLRQSIEGSFFMIDVLRLIPAIDWENSQLRAQAIKNPLPPHELKTYLSLANGFRIRGDIPFDVHIFRDQQNASKIFVSQEMASAMLAENLTGVAFSDPAGALALNSHR